MEDRTLSGVLIGVVHDLNDTTGQGMVKVRFPKLKDKISDWLRLASPMAGPERGLFLRPEKDDQVIVIYEDGRLEGDGYVLGSIWSEPDKPPPDDGDRVKNNWRFIRSRSGHLIKLDDTAGNELIEIAFKDGKRRVVMDDKKIEVHCQTGDVIVKADAGNIAISAPTGNIEIDANQISVKAKAKLILSGATVDIN
jgi:phage baseplate assembly protein gpV